MDISRRQWLKSAGAVGVTAATLRPGTAFAKESSDVVDIGSRRELFVDRYLIEEMAGDARRRMHHPTPQEIAITHDAPWEGSGSGYHSVFHEGDMYRMYYKAWQLTARDGKVARPHPLFACYAESEDGIRWEKPELGLINYDGSKSNNIVLTTGRHGPVHADAGHIAVFKDENPDCPPERAYKAIVRSREPNGLVPFASPDGIHWAPMAEAPVITSGAFDSQNLAFWDPVRGEYRAYWRHFKQGKRDIRTATSPDLLDWSDPVDLKYPGVAREHLYTNQVKPYHRAPHIFIGFPTRYVERGWSDSMKKLPERGHREKRAAANQRFGTALTEGLLMSSRDGRTFHRWPEAFLRPGIQRPGSWHYGQQYIAWHVVETASSLPGAPPELSLYATESYWTGHASKLRRYTLRLDGFVSVTAPLAGGQLTTKPVKFDGDRLEINFSTSAAGGVRVELQDTKGKPLPGFSLADCHPQFGDEVGRVVSWKGGADVSKLAGRPVRLRFELKDADLYAFRFQTVEG